MVDIPTQEPDVVIESRKLLNLNPNDDWVIYRNKNDPTDRWIIRGRCNQCGLCEIGRAKPNPIIFNPLIKIGDADACMDASVPFRSDVPSRPEIAIKARKMRDDLIAQGRKDVSTTGECTLSGEYLPSV